MTTLVMQKQLTGDGAILLIDELEHGLEPFRIRRLITYLRPQKDDLHQVFCCTHSPIALVEHYAKEIHVVREKDGRVDIQQANINLQGALRALSEALFCSKVIICEGNTEWGFSRALEAYWISRGEKPLADANVAFAYASSGGGSKCPDYAKAIASLGYRTALFFDSDNDPVVDIEDLQEYGVEIVQWSGGMALEQRICLDVPLGCLDEMVEIARNNKGIQPIDAAICTRLNISYRTLEKVTYLLSDGVSELDLRTSIGKAAVDNKWFKDIIMGEKLGKLVTTYIGQIPATDTAIKVRQLEEWIYG